MFEWMNTTTVTVKERNGVGPSGKPIEGSTVTLKCRIEPTIKRIIDGAGIEVIAGGYIMFPAGTRFATGSFLEWEGIERRSIKIEPVFLAAENYESHVEGWFN